MSPTRRQLLLKATAAAQPVPTKPNIVLILADDVGYECFAPSPAQGSEGKPAPVALFVLLPPPLRRKVRHALRPPEIRFARDHRYKLYGDGRLFDLEQDPDEQRAIQHQPPRKKLQAALDSMPAHGQAIPAQYAEKSKGTPIPKW